MTPEQELKLFLIKNGYPDRNIPIVLRYCPQLLDSYTVEEIGTLAVTNHRLFLPEKRTYLIRPIIHSAFHMETQGKNSHDFMEEAIAIFCSDSIEDCFKDNFSKLYKTLSKAERIT